MGNASPDCAQESFLVELGGLYGMQDEAMYRTNTLPTIVSLVSEVFLSCLLVATQWLELQAPALFLPKLKERHSATTMLQT